MKLIKNVLEFIITLIKAWKVVLPVLVFVVAEIVAIMKFSNQNIQFLLPVWATVIIFFLALYPICKFVEFIIGIRTKEKFPLNGLLWKPSPFSFRYPEPLCPKKDCGREVICKIIPPKPFALVQSVSDFENVNYQNQYIYECPIHGRISAVPNEDIRILQKKAKLANIKK